MTTKARKEAVATRTERRGNLGDLGLGVGVEVFGVGCSDFRNSLNFPARDGRRREKSKTVRREGRQEPSTAGMREKRWGKWGVATGRRRLGGTPRTTKCRTREGGGNEQKEDVVRGRGWEDNARRGSEKIFERETLWVGIEGGRGEEQTRGRKKGRRIDERATGRGQRESTVREAERGRERRRGKGGGGDMEA